ncbi:hypothetical protein M885DRAFT_530463 [Pelagophyceae sp. CCMP2097]|nr:hypothetical protein M885DRAFT_530463 [Pelagophyceae sp. CCMP2097]|mmetsp:Transcript_18393/g.61991  ORF Transcript_18393/g.61991 Transcript_18393/m.61991 type:complete len:307 (-) Transcript_18393:103-1023(-)
MRTMTAGVFLLWLAPAAAFAPAPGGAALRPRGAALQAASFTGDRVDALLKTNRARVDALAKVADVDELTRLRFALAFPVAAECDKALKDLVTWRGGAGKAIVTSAAAAVALATADGGWDNAPVAAAAPHAALVNKFITSRAILTLSTSDSDLLYVIRASQIDDKKMMDAVAVPQLVDFFLYVKEVHSLVANARSVQTGRLCGVVFANDISGIRAPPDSRFSKALSASSAQYEQLYPAMAGQTLIVNLPFILQAFVGLIKPLFPKSVQARLVFKPAPILAKLKDLTPLTTDMALKKSFLAEIEKLLR